ncbi:MAG: sugar phosphate isomerase/epimerase [Deltaproteobacteria bacterium]|nr:sugar phosphate isomerase/epimerase [Deltaproteobacteria bacterium]
MSGEGRLPNPELKILLSTGSLFHFPLERIAEIGAGAGFDGLELILSDPEFLNVGRVLRDTESCHVLSIHAPFRQWALWGGHFKAWKNSVDLAWELGGVRNVTLHPPFFKPGEFSLYWRFATTGDLAAILDVEDSRLLSLENLPWQDRGPFGKDPLAGLAQACLQKGMGMTLDVCHLGVSGRDILDAWQAVPPGLVRNIHFSDTDGLREHLWPGTGRLPLDRFLDRVGNDEYQGFLTLEVSPGAFDAEDDVVRRLGEWVSRAREALELPKA